MAVTDAQGRFFLAGRRKPGFLLLIPHNVPGPPFVEVRGEHYQPLQSRILFGANGEPLPFALTPQPVR